MQRRNWRSVDAMFSLAIWIALSFAHGGISTNDVQAAQPDGYTSVTPKSPPQVLDGDTFQIDLDGNGRVDLPRERVRLLFVDTPELHKSRKGKDLRFGIPAKNALEKLLSSAPIRINLAPNLDRYGRSLGLVWAGTTNVNLRLILDGHSYFDTRFDYPTRFGDYATAEGAAYDARRGIWSSNKSRNAYLKRLQIERKTPQGKSNPLYVQGLQQAQRLHLDKYMGKYIVVQGTVVEVRILRKGVTRVELRGPAAQRNIRAVAFPPHAALLGLRNWRPGKQVTLRGFVKKYRGESEMRIHFGQ